MTIVPFVKPARSISDQVKLLQSRGLVINDTPLAEHFLIQVGYYRLAGYWQAFQADVVKHIFLPGITFERVIELYTFDRELRFLMYDAIERIEVSIRNMLSNNMCMAYGLYWYRDPAFGNDPGLFAINLDTIEHELDRSKEPFIVHHNSTYGINTYPPAWKTMQVLSFGTLSKLYSNLSTFLPEKNFIARSLGLPNYTWLENWLQSISLIRNLCAHHSRICNRSYLFPPKRLNTTLYPWITQLPANLHFSRLLYNQLCTLKYLLDRVSPGNGFPIKLQELIYRHPGVNLPAMGFVNNWDSESLWTPSSL